ncbi:MAG: thioredoxin domain-containing protein [Thermodesulfobacteriota bacterium]
MSMQSRNPNHLIHETSPYLLQHAHNPVDWYPWGDAAVEKARREDKPIILSIGYSTCHWCHVMEKESFSNAAIAAIMNRYFVNIKVDREERPDLDEIYITAVSAVTGSAGWPLNVFLTPELRPFHGGTYFPSTARFGVISWPDLLQVVHDAWDHPEKRRRLLHSAAELTRLVDTALSLKPGGGMPDKVILEQACKALGEAYDDQRGGFGRAPKFPSAGVLDFLMFYHQLGEPAGVADHGRPPVLEMAVKTLRAMAAGGIYDHLGGGFHRYATDADWRVPHFEKMLYDNAQLIETYLEAYRITGERLFRKTAEDTIGYVLRDMTHPGGGFHSAEDADSPNGHSAPPGGGGEKREGAFYLWTWEEIRSLLGASMAEMLGFRYGLAPGGNVTADPHGEFKGGNIVFAARSLEETAGRFGLDPEETAGRLAAAGQRLFLERGKRVRPDRDDKIITSWNGLMISALVKAQALTGSESYLQAARKAAGFIIRTLFDADTGTLYRTWCAGIRGRQGLASDYAFFIRSLLDLHGADGDPEWLKAALGLNEELIRRFWDAETGAGFFLTGRGQDPYLIVRVKEVHDTVVPSSNSIAAMNLIRMAENTGEERYRSLAEATIQAVMSRIASNPASAPRMLMAFERFRMNGPHRK